MKIRIKTLVSVALLIAMEVVFTRFLSISTPIVRIGFGFVPIAICGMLYGPVWAGIGAAIGDLIGATLFPSGAFFPGFTLSSILTGVIFGLVLYRKNSQNIGWPRISIAVAINCLGISLLLNTLWLSILFDTPYIALLPTRVIQTLIMIPVQFIVLQLLQRPVVLLKKQYSTG